MQYRRETEPASGGNFKVKKLFLIPFFLCLLLSGCADYNELNMQELVSHAGVDFQNDEVFVSVLCEGEEKGIFHSRGKSFFEAVRELSGSLDKKLYWGHAESIVFGEEALESSFDGTVDAVLRARDVYLDIIPVATKNVTAKEVIEKMGEGSAETLSVFVNEGNSRRFKAVPLWRLLRERELYGACVIPSVERKDGGLALSGGAVISEAGLAGYLSENEFLFLSLLTDRTAGGYLPEIKTENAEVSFEILANNLNVKEIDAGFLIEQEITLSPAEMRGNASDSEMSSAAKLFLENGYKKLISLAKERDFGNVFMLKGMKTVPEMEFDIKVTISDVLGGRG